MLVQIFKTTPFIVEVLFEIKNTIGLLIFFGMKKTHRSLFTCNSVI